MNTEKHPPIGYFRKSLIVGNILFFFACISIATQLIDKLSYYKQAFNLENRDILIENTIEKILLLLALTLLSWVAGVLLIERNIYIKS